MVAQLAAAAEWRQEGERFAELKSIAQPRVSPIRNSQASYGLIRIGLSSG
jgi:hypothetical protein